MSRQRLLAQCILVAVLATSLFLGHAQSAPSKPRKPIQESFEISVLPFPVSATVTGFPRCMSGVDHHRFTHEFVPPWAGQLTIRLEGYAGDFDLYVMAGESMRARADSQELGGADDQVYEYIRFEPTPGERLTILACNYLGGPEATLRYEYRPIR